MSTLHPENLATPEEVLTGLAVQVRVAPPVGAVRVRVIGVTGVLMVLPAAFWVATLGCVPKVAPAAVLVDGDRVNASLTAPEEMTKLALTALVRVPEVAVRV